MGQKGKPNAPAIGTGAHTPAGHLHQKFQSRTYGKRGERGRGAKNRSIKSADASLAPRPCEVGAA